MQGPGLLIWIPCVFVSILVHEFGHALSNRLFQDRPWIVLHGMGGVCFSRSDLSPWRRVVVILAGPGAGLLLAGISFGLLLASADASLSPTISHILNYLFMINLFWSIVNLIPIWPLDGGQLLMVLLSLINRRRGARWTHTVGLLGAGILAIYLASKAIQAEPGAGQWWNVLIVGMMAFSNYQQLQNLHNAARYGMDDDWWKG